MTTERMPQLPDSDRPKVVVTRRLPRPLLYSLFGVGGALAIALIVLIGVVRAGASQAVSADADPGSTTVQTENGSPTTGPESGPGSDADGASVGENADDHTTVNGDPPAEAVDDPADQADAGYDGPPISTLGVTSITVTGPGGMSLAQVCAAGDSPQWYGVNQDQQPAIVTWTTVGATKTTLDVNGTLVFQQPVSGQYQFVFDCFSNSGVVNTWRFEVNAADSSNNVKSKVVYANAVGTTGLVDE